MTAAFDQQIVKDRIALCRVCPERRPGWVCAQCQCPLAHKVFQPSAHCPIGKW
jgi:hypothetical protein